MKQGEINIRNDPFIIGMMERLSPNERGSFSDEQLVSLKTAFGARTWGIHPVDLRWTIKIWRKRYYFVFVAGVNRRPLSRRQQELARVGMALLMTGVIGFSMLLGLLFLYLLKSAAGIDIDPDSSLGIWDWFKTELL
jgi:hypothetical protein